jgi:putative transcriptional regulator
MIAVRAHPVKPRMAVYVKPKAVDPLAPKLADMEKVVLVKTDLDESTIVERLRYLR